MRLPREALSLALPVLVASCAAPTLQTPNSNPADVAREAAIQRKFVIDRIKSQQERVSRVMFRISVGAANLCNERVTGAFGLAGITAKQFPGEYEAIARNEFGFDDGLTITAVFPGSPAEAAGLMAGDRIISFGNGSDARSGRLSQAVLQTAARNRQAIQIEYRRHGETMTTAVAPLLACNYPVQINQDTSINAYSDGDQVVFQTGLLDFVSSDEELAVVASHEVSHNILDHAGKKKENVLVGGALGLAADILVIAATGVNPGLYRAGEKAGAHAYSVEFEKEADYEGLYLMRRAGYSIRSAPNLWRRFGAQNPGNISIGNDHPTTPERFIAMNATIVEIESKDNQRLALVPNLKTDIGDKRIAVATAPAGGSRVALTYADPVAEHASTALAAMPIVGDMMPSVTSPALNRSPLLGIARPADVNSESVAAVFMGRDPHGVAVGLLEADGPAAKAGVRAGDVITGIDGHRIDTIADLKTFIAAATGPEIKVELNRSGKLLAVRVQL
jgi:S1-C subfamily serine protease